MHTFLEFGIGNLVLLRELKQLTHFAGHPDSIPADVEFPHTELPRFGRKCDAFLKFAQSLFFPKQFRDVDARTDVTKEILLRVITRHSAVGNPAVFAIVAS